MKLTRIETIHVPDVPLLLFVRLTTDEGLIGYGETFYAPMAVRGFIHEFAAPLLLGQDPLAVEQHWRTIYGQVARFGGKGAEVRGLSALDVALWDILAQAANLPLYRVLGAARDRIRTYNTCGGPYYGRGEGAADRWDDLTAFLRRADELAEDLLSEGITGMKIWPFDRYALEKGGLRIDAADLDAGLEPFRKIRRAVGMQMDVMLEGHGYWSLPAAIRIARAVEEFEPAWLEDLILAHDVGSLAELRSSTSTPLLASEFLITRYEYRPLLEQRAVDIVMIDPTWTGGVTESRKIASMADAYNLPVTTHDCTGPFTLFAGIHLALSAPNAVYQETVRAYLRTFYRDLVTESVTIEAGHILAPTGAGLGTALLPDVTSRPGVSVVESTI